MSLKGLKKMILGIATILFGASINWGFMMIDPLINWGSLELGIAIIGLILCISGYYQKD
jgi:hypothetical protein